MVYVLTGVYYDDSFKLSQPNATKQHQIPAGYWEIIILQSNPVKIISFIMPQDAKSKNYCDYNVSIDQISKVTNLIFFTNDLSGDINNILELGCN